jgi:hypothetical protein
MAQFRESGITNEVTTGNLSSDSYFVMATSVGTLDDVVPQPVFFDWLIDPSGPIEYTTNVGIGIASDSIAESMLTPAVRTKLNSGGGGGSSRKDGFDDLGNQSTTMSIDFTAGSYDNKRFQLSATTTVVGVTATEPGAYELMIDKNGHAFVFGTFFLPVEPVLTDDGYNVIRLYYLPDGTWTY